jgi:hypothetical protein
MGNFPLTKIRIHFTYTETRQWPRSKTGPSFPLVCNCYEHNHTISTRTPLNPYHRLKRWTSNKIGFHTFSLITNLEVLSPFSHLPLFQICNFRRVNFNSSRWRASTLIFHNITPTRTIASTILTQNLMYCKILVLIIGTHNLQCSYGLNVWDI